MSGRQVSTDNIFNVFAVFRKAMPLLGRFLLHQILPEKKMYVRDLEFMKNRRTIRFNNGNLLYLAAIWAHGSLSCKFYAFPYGN